MAKADNVTSINQPHTADQEFDEAYRAMVREAVVEQARTESNLLQKMNRAFRRILPPREGV